MAIQLFSACNDDDDLDEHFFEFYESGKMMQMRRI
jgi:hypothetical protein